MKRRVTRIFYVLLVLAMLLSQTACTGGDKAESADSGAPATVSAPEHADAEEPGQADGNDHIIPLDCVLFDNEDFYAAVTGFDTSYELNGDIVQGLMIDFANRTTETDINSPNFIRANLDILDVVVNGCRTLASRLNGYELSDVDPGASVQGFRFCSPSEISGVRYIDTLTFQCVISNSHGDTLYQDTFTLEIHAGEGEAVYTPEFDGAPFILVETDECLVELAGYTDEPDTGIRRYIVHTVNNTDQTIHADVYQYDVNGISDFYTNSFYAKVQPHTDQYSTFYFNPNDLESSGVYTVYSIKLNSLACYYQNVQEDGSRKAEYIVKTDVTIPDPGEAVGPLVDPDGSAGA